MDLSFIQRHVEKADTKIVMLILDGLGGLPLEAGGMTELESAHTPHLDALAERSILGLTLPVAPGITPGSGPGHLAIFGYDPIRYEIGRGALEALGVDFELGADDIAARGNFCTVDPTGIITDRRAGRPPTETTRELVERLRTIRLNRAELFIEPVKEHRFAFVLRGSGLCPALSDSDPLKTGVLPLPVLPLCPESDTSAGIVNEFIRQSRQLLARECTANMVLLRGFAKFPSMPQFADIFGLKAAAIAIHGMYRGVAKLVGMQVLEVKGSSLEDEFTTLEQHWSEFNFFYLHVKKTDTCGENGDFAGKMHAIEEVDEFIPRILALQPDVVIVGGDHSSPAVLRSHSWHPVPILIYAKPIRADGIAQFGERACSRGSLGILPAKDVMPIALANAGRIAKFGA